MVTPTKLGSNRGGVTKEHKKTCNISKMRAREDQCYYYRLTGSHICAFDLYQNQRPWMTLNGVSTPGTAQSFKVPTVTIITGTGKATDFKFDRYIHRVHLNKGSLKILEKREHGHNQGHQLSRQQWSWLRPVNCRICITYLRPMYVTCHAHCSLSAYFCRSSVAIINRLGCMLLGEFE